jgi:hypothetical protein
MPIPKTYSDLSIKAVLESGWSIPVWILIYLALTSLLQHYVPFPVDDDTAYHYSVGQLIRKYGILYNFPWTPFSLQFDHYADKEFFFHLLFVPLGGLGFVTAARLVGAVAGALALTTLYLVLRAERVTFPGLWALLPLFCSEFVFRFALVRPHLLSITLALLVLWAFARGRLYILAAASILYPLSYVAFWQIPLILIIATCFARILSSEKIHWKAIVIVMAGIAVGLALHPNTLNLLGINWLHMSDILFQGAWGKKIDLNLGKEFNPYPIADWVRYLLVAVFSTGTALAVSWRERNKCSLPLAFAITALFFGLLTVKSLRFVEYFVPFSAAAIALASPMIRIRHFAPALFCASFLYMLAFGMEPYRILASKGPYIAPDTAKYFEQQIPVGSQVFTCGWDYTGNLMLALPERRFMVAADPTLFYKKDPELYRIWSQTPLMAPLDSAQSIRNLFGCRFVVCLNYEAYWKFFDTLRADPAVRLLFADERWLLFDLGNSTDTNR